jgi:hypothetical protein
MFWRDQVISRTESVAELAPLPGARARTVQSDYMHVVSRWLVMNNGIDISLRFGAVLSRR